MEKNSQDGRNDFDFFLGTWTIHNRKLDGRLVGSTSWQEFDGHVTCRPILGGLGNFDECVMNIAPQPLDCITLRTFDPTTCEWSLYWSDTRLGILLPPMIGKFENGRGEFYAHETHNNKHIFSRFIWSGISDNACHWEQAFSPDGGKTWETNWTMDFTRQ